MTSVGEIKKTRELDATLYWIHSSVQCYWKFKLYVSTRWTNHRTTCGQHGSREYVENKMHNMIERTYGMNTE